MLTGLSRAKLDAVMRGAVLGAMDQVPVAMVADSSTVNPCLEAERCRPDTVRIVLWPSDGGGRPPSGAGRAASVWSFDVGEHRTSFG